MCLLRSHFQKGGPRAHPDVNPPRASRVQGTFTSSSSFLRGPGLHNSPDPSVILLSTQRPLDDAECASVFYMSLRGSVFASRASCGNAKVRTDPCP